MGNQSVLKWETISDVHKLISLFEDWVSLNNAAPHSTLFNSPHWLLTWVKQYWQDDWQLSLLIARHEGKLVVLAPFYIQPPTVIFGAKKLFPLGQGEPEHSEISSEYNNILILPGFEKLVLQKIKKWILNVNVDEIIWRATLANSNVLNLFQSRDLPLTKSEATRYIVNSQTWTPEVLSKNMRSRYRRGLNQLSRLGATIDWVNKESIDQYWLIMKGFHQNRWQSKDKKGAFCCDEFNIFHADFRKNSPESVAMSAILVNNLPIAIHYYFIDSTTLYFYQSGWNENEHSNLSPGLILHLWSIENNNKQFYDFMMGAKNDSYKSKFGCKKIPMSNIRVILSPKKVFINSVLNKFFNSLKIY
jgi:hypothetical protein